MLNLLILLGLLFVFYILNRSFTENFDNKKYDALIISPGGGGTTYFLKYLNDNTDLKINHIHDIDGNKHISTDQKNKLNNINCDKIIYLYNDPKLAIDSHYRRNWGKTQLLKLGDPYNIKNIINDKNAFEKNIIEKNKDLYGIESQFDFFLNDKGINKDILFIDFNNIQNNKHTISDFLKIDSKVFNNLSINKRNSSYDNIEDQKYLNVYNNLYEKMKKHDGYIKNNINSVTF